MAVQLAAPIVALVIAAFGVVWDGKKRRADRDYDAQQRREDREREAEKESARALARARRLRYEISGITVWGNQNGPGVTSTDFTVMNTDVSPIYDLTIGPVRLEDGPEGVHWQPDSVLDDRLQVLKAGDSHKFGGSWPGHDRVEGFPEAAVHEKVHPRLEWTDVDGRRFQLDVDGKVSEIVGE